ncbi:hypothetical protein RCL1_003125 [Eukaryota sp. TZLM3-RCL]
MITQHQRQELYHELLSMGFKHEEIESAFHRDPHMATLDQIITAIEINREQNIQTSSRSSALVSYDNTNNAYARHEDEVLKQAIQASLADYTQQEIARSNQEIELQKAIESSLSSFSVPNEDPNPNHRVRQSGMPVGLKNVGNSCYLASIIQTLFIVPKIRQLIVTYTPPADPHNHKNYYAIKVVMELQKVFSYMILSQRSYITPTDLVAAIYAVAQSLTGFDALVPGAQHDATEFLIRFLEVLEFGLGSDDITHCFRGFFFDIVTCTGPNGEKVEVSRQTEPFVFIPIPLDSAKDLETALDAKIDPVPLSDFHLPPSHSNPQMRSIIQSFSQCTAFAIQRYRYDASQKETRKLHDKFSFPLQIHGKRYKLENQDMIDSVHHQREVLQEELSVKESALSTLTNFEGTNLPLSRVLSATCKFLTHPHDYLPGRSVPISSMATELQHLVTEAEQQIQHRKQEVDEVVDKIKQIYAPLSGEPLQLLTILLHHGSTTSGHYWSYIGHPMPREDCHSPTVKRQWFKYNDQHISKADEDELMVESFGTFAALGSAYFLVYGSCDVFNNFYQMPQVPDHLAKEIEEDNAKLEDELRTWSNRYSPPDPQDFLQRLEAKIEKVNRQWDEYRKIGGLPDPRITSFPVYLLSLGDGPAECANSVVARDVWLENYPEKDLTDVSVRGAVDRVLGNQRSILTSLNDLGDWYKGWISLTHSAFHFLHALEDLHLLRLNDAISHLLTAISHHLLVSPSINLIEHIQLVLRVVLFNFWKTSQLDLSRIRAIPTLLDQGVQKLTKIIKALSFLGSSDWFVLYLTKEISHALTTLPIPQQKKQEIDQLLMIIGEPVPITTPQQPLDTTQMIGLDTKLAATFKTFTTNNKQVIDLLNEIKNSTEEVKGSPQPMEGEVEGAGLGASFMQ